MFKIFFLVHFHGDISQHNFTQGFVLSNIFSILYTLMVRSIHIFENLFQIPFPNVVLFIGCPLKFLANKLNPDQSDVRMSYLLIIVPYSGYVWRVVQGRRPPSCPWSPARPVYLVGRKTTLCSNRFRNWSNRFRNWFLPRGAATPLISHSVATVHWPRNKNVQLLNFIFKISVKLFWGTALRNQMQIVFKEMSSWTPLTMYLGMKTTFQTKYIQNKYDGFLL